MSALDVTLSDNMLRHCDQNSTILMQFNIITSFL